MVCMEMYLTTHRNIVDNIQFSSQLMRGFPLHCSFQVPSTWGWEAAGGNLCFNKVEISPFYQPCSILLSLCLSNAGFSASWTLI